MSSTNSGIIGHEKILSFLSRSLENGRLSQAYLFVGPPGVGKTAVAEWLIKKLLGEQGFNHSDVTVLNRSIDEKTEKVKTEIVIDQIRKLNERLSMSGFMGGQKVAFIEEADFMNTEASNALLKTLEEPTAGTTLILRATSVDRVLPTIASRCQIIRFTSVPRLKIVEALAGRGVIRKEAEDLAALSGGCPGYALSLLRDEETRALEETSVEQFIDLLRSSVSVRLARVASLLPKDEANKKEQLKNLLDRWECLLRDVLLISSGSEDWALRSSAYPEIIQLAKNKSSDHWLNALENLRTVKKDLAFHVNPALALEHLFLTF